VAPEVYKNCNNCIHRQQLYQPRMQFLYNSTGMNASGSTNDLCEAHYNGAEEGAGWRCLFGANVAQFVQAPMMVSGSVQHNGSIMSPSNALIGTVGRQLQVRHLAGRGDPRSQVCYRKVHQRYTRELLDIIRSSHGQSCPRATCAARCFLDQLSSPLPDGHWRGLGKEKRKEHGNGRRSGNLV
jgi:hypothetical protein